MTSNLNELIIEPVLSAQSKDLQELITELEAYNYSKLGDNHKQPIMSMIKQPNGKLVGGVFAYLSYGWCTIELLWIDEQYRGNDLATKILKKIEAFAINEGVIRFKVETGSFQALDFYKKQGFEVYAELEDYPLGHTNYYCRKII